MLTLVTLVLTALATARITRLITTDRITQAPRYAILRRLNEDNLAAYLLTCDWCASMYVGAGAAGAWVLWGDTTAYLATCAALAFSYTAGFLASRESGE